MRNQGMSIGNSIKHLQRQQQRVPVTPAMTVQARRLVHVSTGCPASTTRGTFGCRSRLARQQQREHTRNDGLALRFAYAYDSRQYDPRLTWLPITCSTPIAAAALSITSEASLAARWLHE